MVANIYHNTLSVEYNLSFTAGALLFEESKTYLEAISNYESFVAGEEKPSYTALSTNSESSKKRLKAELDKRLHYLSQNYLENFHHLDQKDQKIILFLAFCKCYGVMTEFVMEVVYEKWKIFDFDLSTYDFEYFLNEKLNNRSKKNITDKTKYKLAQIALKTLKELGMVTETEIHPIKPSDALHELFKENGDLWFLNCLLITNPNQLN